jgi:hypothetical protein
MNLAIHLARDSKKFLLPTDGKILEDADLRALVGLERLRLPFHCIAIEFKASEGRANSKSIIFAREVEEKIEIVPVMNYRENGYWYVGPSWSINTADGVEWLGDGNGVGFLLDREDERLTSDAMWGPTFIVASLLNALACSNVRAEVSSPIKQPKKSKNTLPFDSYHVLTIGAKSERTDGALSGSHAFGRSPREHLRRGHIRRYESGLRIWVNATVVNAGSGGKITKDYRVQKAAP